MTTAEVMDAIYVEGVCRRQLHSAEKRLGLQIKAILRSLKRGEAEEVEDEEEDHTFDGLHGVLVPSSSVLKDDGAAVVHPSDEDQFTSVHTAPSSVLESALGPVLIVLEEHRKSLKKSRRTHEKTLEALAEQLPVWSEWVAGVRGCGPLGLALIIAETGDLANYATVSRVWKRLGLAVIDGDRQRRVTDAAAAKLHGYSPRRRAVAWNMGEGFVKQGERYRDLYLARKAIEAAKPPCGKSWRTKAGGMKACEKDGHCRPSHIHARARRWTEKKFLADLWGAWNHKVAPAVERAA